jgi:hypothetical protein
MRRRYCTLTPSLVRAVAHAALRRALPWADYGRQATAQRLVDALLLVAALCSSLFAVVRRFAFGFSHETARQAVQANLPDVGVLTQGLLDALYAFGGRAWRKRRFDVAVDLHYCPFYGDRHAQGVVGGPHKQGTRYFYAYATAILLHRRQRYTVGLVPVCGSQQPHRILAAVLDQLRARGLRLRGVALDSGFDSGDTIGLLQRLGLSYVLPLRRKGQGPNARNDWFERPHGQVFSACWTTDRSRRKTRTSAVVGRRPHDGKVMVYAFGGWGQGAARAAAAKAGRARLARRKYRSRYGIETSYRQLNQGKGTTTAKGVAYRLLLLGLALLLRQAWVWLSRQVALDRGLGLGEWLGELTLPGLLGWLADALRQRYRERRVIRLGQPLSLPEGLIL